MSEDRKTRIPQNQTFFQRLRIAFVRIFWFFVILVGGIGGSVFLIDREFDNVRIRIDANKQRIELLDEFVDSTSIETDASLDSLAGEQDAATDQIDTFSTELETISSELGTMSTEFDTISTEFGIFADQLESQSEVLSQLETQLQTLVEQTGQTDEALTSLQLGVNDLQQDVIDNTSSIDVLGGTVDAAVGDLDARLSEVASTTQTLPSPEALEALQEAMVLFRVWEAISRARFHLLDGNAGLATDDVALALATAETLPPQDNLDELLTRLTLSLENLPNEPELAAQDLLTAWDEIDTLLGIYIGLPVIDAQPLDVSVPVTLTTTITPTTVITP